MFDRHKAFWPPGVPHRLELPERTLHQNLSATAARLPDKTATLFHGKRRTYREIAEAVEALAGYLQQVCGVARGDRVLLYMQNAPQFIVAYYAILRADAVVVPVNPMNRAAELDYLVGDTGAEVAIAGQELLPHIAPQLASGQLKRIVAAAYADEADPAYDLPLPEAIAAPAPKDYGIPGVVAWPEALASGRRAAPSAATPDDLAVIPYSSGTTGQPKGCMHTHRTVMATLVGGLVWNPSTEDDTHLATLPLFHVTGMQNSMGGPIYVGGTMAIVSRWDRRLAATLIARHRITRWRSISTMAIDLVRDPDIRSFDLSSLKAIGGGGAAMPEAVAAKLKEITGLDYIEGYGLSETVAATHINPVHRPKRACLGIPLFDVDCRILDVEIGRPLGPGEPGEIALRCPQLFEGYWRRPEETAAAHIEVDGERFFRTGDIATYDDEGYFFIVDRVKRMINCAGFKVWPTEVEALMHRHPGIAEVCVVAMPDQRRGESVKAYVVPRGDAAETLTEEAVIAWCRETIAAYKCPRAVTLLDALPRSGSGKVMWRDLQERACAETSAA